MKTLYLVDVSSMYFRAFYAVRPLSNKSGLPTNALYGFMSMAVKLLKDVRPDYLAFCFDVKEPSFRHKIYSEYKANRSEMPADLIPQVPYVRKLSMALAAPIFERPGYEADDLIGTLTHFGRKENLEVVIVSGDKDFAQLIGPFVSMYDTMKEVRYDADGVIEKWGVNPAQMIDYLSLIGDASDNIPGVRGIGPKTAQKLLAEYKTLDNLYEHIGEIKSESLRTKLVEHKNNAYLSKELVTIETKINLGITLEDLKMKPIPEKDLYDLLEELDFKSFERRLLGTGPLSATPSIATSVISLTAATDIASPGSFKESSEKPKVERVFESAQEKSVTAQQLENLIGKGDELWGISTERGLYVAHNSVIYRLEGELENFRDVFNRKSPRWKGFDLKIFWHTLKLTNPELLWDSALASYVVRAGEVPGFAETYQKFTGAALPELPSGSALFQAQQQLESALIDRLNELHGQKVLQELDMPIEPVLYAMEKKGVLVDVGVLKKQSQQTELEIHALEKKIFKETGQTFALNSPKQLSEVLFNKLKMPVMRKTKTGYSTDSDVLQKLSKDYPVCTLIIDYRELTKLKSTYLDSLPLLVDSKTGRIHTHFNQVLTATGRLSSINPNLQNIPVRTERGQRVRQAFTVDAGHILVSADYSQIELRILAHITGDPGLVAAFEADHDIHAATAAEIFDIPIEQITADQRRMAKAVNFGLAYGMSPFGLSENLNIAVSDATEIIRKYFVRFKLVREYMNETVELAKRQGFVETIFGRRRYLDELKSKNGTIRKFGERAAINAPMQGSTADLMKKAMIEIDAILPGTMTLQVHDELIFEIEESRVTKAIQQIKSVMENVVKLRVPLKVNVASGANWDSAH